MHYADIIEILFILFKYKLFVFLLHPNNLVSECFSLYQSMLSPKSEFIWLCYKVEHPQWQQYMAQYFTFFCVEYPFGPWGVTNQFSL
jgi:hypothetical protein